MKRVFAGLVFVVLAACADSPTEVPPLDEQNARRYSPLSSSVDQSGTWMFEADVDEASGDFPGTTSSTLTGWITFTLQSEDRYSGYSCYDSRDEVGMTFTYIVDGGVTRTISGNGTAWLYAHTCYGSSSNRLYFRIDEDENYTYFQINTDNLNEISGALPDIYSYSSYSDFDQSLYDSEENLTSHFRSTITSLYSPPATTRECRNGGWQDFGFADELQCIGLVKSNRSR